MAQAEFLTVSMTEGLRAKLDSYCKTCVMDPSDVIDKVLADFLANREPEVQSLVNGYREMATLNTEICHEFTACESEAYDQIR
ncbi:antitoxin [Lacticaseibacillus sp. GG6-2]